MKTRKLLSLALALCLILSVCAVCASAEEKITLRYAYWGSSYENEAMLNIGSRPTFDGKKRTIEAHILDFSGDIYGGELAVAFYSKIREERRFRCAAELAAQLKRDEKEVRDFFCK